MCNIATSAVSEFATNRMKAAKVVPSEIFSIDGDQVHVLGVPGGKFFARDVILQGGDIHPAFVEALDRAAKTVSYPVIDAVQPIFRIGKAVLESDTAPNQDGTCALTIRCNDSRELSLAMTVFELAHGEAIDIEHVKNCPVMGLYATVLVPHHLAKRFVWVDYFETEGSDCVHPEGTEIFEYPPSEAFVAAWQETECEDFAAHHPLVKAAIQKAA